MNDFHWRQEDIQKLIDLQVCIVCQKKVEPRNDCVLVHDNCVIKLRTLIHLLREIADQENAQAFCSAIECSHGFDGEMWMKQVQQLLNIKEKSE